MFAASRACHLQRRRSDRPHPATAFRLFLLFSALHAALLISAAIALWRHYA